MFCHFTVEVLFDLCPYLPVPLIQLIREVWRPAYIWGSQRLQLEAALCTRLQGKSAGSGALGVVECAASAASSGSTRVAGSDSASSWALL